MPNHPDVSVQIRAFLVAHPGQYCEPCLVKETGLRAGSVKAAFKPSKENPYSFMPACCSHCEQTALCVAYVGEPEAATPKLAAAALFGPKHQEAAARR